MGILSLSKSASLLGLGVSEGALLVCGFVLAIGLIGEYAKSEKWKKHVKAFEMMIILGVAGELIADGGVFLFSGHLQTIADAELAWVTTDVGNTRLAADKAASAAARAEASSKQADIEAGNAQKKADAVEKQANELNRQLLAAKTQLDAVDAKRAELEKSLINLAVCNAPRVLPLWSIGNTKTSVDPLKPFAGRQAIIEFVPDAEARRAALHIAGSLDRAGWKIAKLAPVDGIDDGVDIQHFVGPRPDQTQEWYSLWQAEIRSSDAAAAVVDFLHSYNWQAKLGWPLDERGSMIRDPKIIPPDGLRIRVGLYPAITHVSPPGAKDLAAAMAQFEQERDKSKKQMEQQQLRRDEEILKNLTPQQAIEFKAHREQWEKETKLLMERYTSPCQPLNPLVPSLR